MHVYIITGLYIECVHFLYDPCNNSKQLTTIFHMCSMYSFYCCTGISCGQPPNILNAYMSQANATYTGDTFIHKCIPGYELIGEPTICLSTHEWSSSPKCQSMWLLQHRLWRWFLLGLTWDHLLLYLIDTNHLRVLWLFILFASILSQYIPIWFD